jgi:hypothetical protein
MVRQFHGRKTLSSAWPRDGSGLAVDPPSSTDSVGGPACLQAPGGLEPVESRVEGRLGRFWGRRRLRQPNQDFVSGQAVAPDCRHDGGDRPG